MIQLGAVLTVKVSAGSEHATGGATWEGWYAIEPGDTLGRAAQKIGVSIADLERANKLRPGADSGGRPAALREDRAATEA
ncbi:MAG: LysM domain-containing protein [Myxococcota bacterium]